MRGIDKIITFSILVLLSGLLTLSINPFIKFPMMLLGVSTPILSWVVFGALVYISYKFTKHDLEG